MSSEIDFKFVPAEYTGGQLVDGKPGNSFEDTFDSVFECIQNCIDARVNDETKAVLKIHFKKVFKSDLKFLDSRFTKHVNTSIRCKDRFCLQENVVNLLIMEDFNTSGITGNPSIMNDQTDTGAPNNYFNMNFNFGGNPKLVDYKLGGSEGEGRQSFCLSSKISTFFYYSIDSTNNNRGCFFGISYLGGRTVDETKFYSYAYFGEEKIDQFQKLQCIPLIKNDQLKTLANLFKLKRNENEPGTSIIIPYFLEELNNKQLLISKIIDIYRVAILRGKLEVHVEEVQINKNTILLLNQKSIEEDGKEFSKQQKDLCEEYYKFLDEINQNEVIHNHEINFSNSTKLEKTDITDYEKLISSYNSDKLVKIRLNFLVNRINEEALNRTDKYKEFNTYLDIYFKKYPSWSNILDKFNDFIRGPMSIHKLRKKTMQMFWLVDIQDEHAALMIKNSEKANHSNISGENNKLQRNYKGAKNLVNLLKNLPQKIYNLITNDENTTDRDITKDLFSVPDVTYGIRNTKNSLQENDDEDQEDDLITNNPANSKKEKEIDPIIPPIFEKLKYYLQESKEVGNQITYNLKGIKYDKNKIRERLKLAEDFIEETLKISRSSFQVKSLKKMDDTVQAFKRRILEYKDYISSGYTFYPRRIEIDAAYDGEGVSNPFKKYSILDFDFGDDQQFIFNLKGNIKLVQKNENKIRLVAKNEDFSFSVTGFNKDSSEDVRWKDRSINLDEPNS